MNRIFRILLVAAVAACCLSSCRNAYKDLAITSFDLVSLTPAGMKGADAVVRAGVHNPAGAFTLRHPEGIVKYNSEPVARLTTENVRIAARCDSTYTLRVHCSLEEGVSAMRLLPLLSKRNKEAFTADFSARAVLRGKLGKDIAYTDIPLGELIEKAGK